MTYSAKCTPLLHPGLIWLTSAGTTCPRKQKGQCCFHWFVAQLPKFSCVFSSHFASTSLSVKSFCVDVCESPVGEGSFQATFRVCNFVETFHQNGHSTFWNQLRDQVPIIPTVSCNFQPRSHQTSFEMSTPLPIFAGRTEDESVRPKNRWWTISSFPKCSQITVGDVRTTSWKTGTHGSPSESSPALQVPWINNVSCTVDRIYIMIHVITTYFMSSWQVLVMPHNRVITLVHINSSSWCSICRIIVLRAYQHGTTAMYDLSVASMVVRSALLKLHMPLTEYA